MRALVWLRQDLRVRDNTALFEACKQAERGVVAIFLVAHEQWKEHDDAGVKIDFWLRNLAELSKSLEKRNVALLVREAPTFEDAPKALLDVAKEHHCNALFFNKQYEVNEARRDAAVTDSFTKAGLDVRSFTDQTVFTPDEVRTKQGTFYTVYTPYKKRWIETWKDRGGVEPLALPKRQAEMVGTPDDVPKSAKGFESHVKSPEEHWPAGEDKALARLERFAKGRMDDYDEQRDLPAVDGTSRTSPYLTAGVVSPRQCLAAALDASNGRIDSGPKGAKTWMEEIIWREFYRHVLVGYPRVSMHEPFKRETDRIKWSQSTKRLEAWQEGRTGFPIIDAAMRQLSAIGWMHNRLRMIVAMFLTKDLFLDWREGERWFMRHLIDGDLASNNGGWQWSASTGTDAQPYFRIFNPWTQGARFDKQGAFIYEYCPELESVPARALHDEDKLRGALNDFNSDYPRPIVDHAEARENALAAFKSL